jgi:hypothetical protein
MRVDKFDEVFSEIDFRSEEVDNYRGQTIMIAFFSP